MGNFVCAVVILALVVIFTGVNSAIVCNVCDDMLDLIDSGRTEEACALWLEKRSYIELFIRDAEIDVVNAEVKNMGDTTVIEDGEAETARVRLREAVEELKDSEHPTLRSVF